MSWPPQPKRISLAEFAARAHTVKPAPVEPKSTVSAKTLADWDEFEAWNRSLPPERQRD
jgi:hypothetical protein